MRSLVTALLIAGAAGAFTAAFAIRSKVGHPVTSKMQADAKGVAGRVSPSLPASARGRPAVLVFIEDGCPCSEALEPYARQLFDIYRDRVAFIGVVAGRPEKAADWSERHQTPYPVLADPELAIARALGADRSAYVAIIEPKGTVERLWPGYSAGMLRDLGARLATLADVPETPLDLDGAPSELTSGCSLSP